MSPVQEKFEFLMQEVEKYLAPEGFRRSGKYFRKSCSEGGVRWSIWPQKSRHSTAQAISFTFWATAEWKRRPADYEDWAPRSTWYSGAGGRIGDMMPKKEDTWWDIDESTSAEFLSDQFNAVLGSCALPFLRRFQTEQNIRDYLKSLAGEMRLNYPHVFTMLEFDLEEKRPASEIQKWLRKIRFLGKIQLVNKEVVEERIQRVLKAYGYEEPKSSSARDKPWWKLWS